MWDENTCADTLEQKQTVLSTHTHKHSTREICCEEFFRRFFFLPLQVLRARAKSHLFCTVVPFPFIFIRLWKTVSRSFIHTSVRIQSERVCSTWKSYGVYRAHIDKCEFSESMYQWLELYVCFVSARLSTSPDICVRVCVFAWMCVCVCRIQRMENPCSGDFVLLLAVEPSNSMKLENSS